MAHAAGVSAKVYKTGYISAFYCSFEDMERLSEGDVENPRLYIR